MIVRRATRDDLPRLLELLERYYAEWEVIQRDLPDDIAEYLKEAVPFGFVIAEQDGGLIGCVHLRPLPSIQSAAECKRLYVLPDHRGRGIASRLIESLESYAQDQVREIYLDTGANFTAAQSFYRAQGYDSCERYNDNPQASCFFRKSLRG